MIVECANTPHRHQNYYSTIPPWLQPCACYMLAPAERSSTATPSSPIPSKSRHQRVFPTIAASRTSSAVGVPTATSAEDGRGKGPEVYCLSILPGLGEWTYARWFLRYEMELPAHSREVLMCACYAVLRTPVGANLCS